MNVRPATVAIPPQENSDTDSDQDEELPEYYQPISGFEEADGEQLANGYAENGISDGDNSSSEEEDEELAVVVSDSEIVRALREDESRRGTPLSAETATRVMEAMRGVSFPGVAPDWAARVPEDQWIHQLRRIRGDSS